MLTHKLKWRLESTGTEIVYDDEHVIVLNKPANLLVLPDRFHHNLPNLHSILTEELGAIFAVHWIDKETSGIVLFAKTSEARSALDEQIQHRMVEKIGRASCR